jgi:transcriptional regulator with XRE-family HTH domain
MPKIPDFADALAAEMARAGLSVKQLASRLRIHANGVEKILSRRANASAERQAAWLAACRMPAPDVAALMAAFHEDMAERIATLTNDLETLIADKRPTYTAADAVDALPPAPATDRQTPRTATRRPRGR